MANEYISTASTSLGGTVGGAGLVQKAYDRLLEFALRDTPLIRAVADKRPARQAIPGSTVVLQRYVDLTPVTSTLSETVDPESVALSTPTTVTITLNEYGNAAIVTRALNLFSLADVDPAVANILAFNMADSIDDVAETTLRAGDNVEYGGTSTSLATIGTTAGHNISSADIRKIRARLRSNKAVARRGSMYWAALHPDVAHDLKAESGNGSWRSPHEQSDPANIYAGEIGEYEGFFFIENPRLYSAKDGADQSTFTTTAAASSASAATVISVASTSGMTVGDKISGTGVGTSAKISAISGTNITVSVANSAQVTSGATLTITPVTRVYRSYFAGQQALAEAVAEEPHTVIGPVTDKLMRFRPIGWYGVLGFAIYRQEALYRLESNSSITLV